MEEDTKAFILTPQGSFSDESLGTKFFNSLFDIKRLVFIKSDDKSLKGQVTEVVLALNSENNADMLESSLTISEVVFTSRRVTAEEAERVVKKNKTKLYVGNLIPGIDNVKLWHHFSKYGPIEYTYIIKHPKGKAKGFGFIVFEKKSSFESAFKSKHFINGHRLICKHFNSKNKNIKEEDPEKKLHKQLLKTVQKEIRKLDIYSKKEGQFSQSTGSSNEDAKESLHKPSKTFHEKTSSIAKLPKQQKQLPTTTSHFNCDQYYDSFDEHCSNFGFNPTFQNSISPCHFDTLEHDYFPQNAIPDDEYEYNRGAGLDFQGKSSVAWNPHYRGSNYYNQHNDHDCRHSNPRNKQKAPKKPAPNRHVYEGHGDESGLYFANQGEQFCARSFKNVEYTSYRFKQNNVYPN